MYPDQDLHKFQTFKIYLYYRILLACVLFSVQRLDLFDSDLGNFSPALFSWACMAYAILSIGSLAFLRHKNSFNSLNTTTFLLLCDLIAFTLILHSSGGLQSGLGYLLIINAAIASMFLQGQLAIGFAALITLMLIGETIFINQSESKATLTQSLFSAGLLGFLVFISSITFYYLTEKIKRSSQEALRQSRYAEQTRKLAQHIVTRMQTGIVVINEHNSIELINESAMQMLELPNQNYASKSIEDISNLHDTIMAWRKNPVHGLPKFHKLATGNEIRINFASLQSDNSNQTILYLEDYRAIIQQAQQLKLASLGRLTASIAHEIRNPLGAISHAAQLLRESEDLKDYDLRFAEIILQHTSRVNHIIENILTLSRRKEPNSQLLKLEEWIPEFIEEYRRGRDIHIHYETINEHPPVKMDPNHLRQVLTNLFDNGLRYSKALTGDETVTVQSGQNVHRETTFIQVIDKGPGVSQDKVQHIFEPFFTTDEEGSGLGLYICRELCEINQANLQYEKTEQQNSCFKISFPHHQRMT
ncbi:Sporulation kinase D [Thalassocella blandensis]|nr:Sporulation kinase D [Thalassocella blandensis]